MVLLEILVQERKNETFDSMSNDLNPSSNEGEYFSNTAIHVVAGTYSLSFSNTRIGIIDNEMKLAVDTYDVASDSVSAGAAIMGFVPVNFGLYIEDVTESMFSSDSLPLSPPSFAQGSGFVGIGFFNPNTNEFGSIGATLDSISIAQVPEPTSCFLLVFGAAGLLCKRMSRSGSLCNGSV